MILHRRFLLISIITFVGTILSLILVSLPTVSAAPAEAPPQRPFLQTTPVISLTQITAGLTLPTDITHAGDGRLFITEQDGTIRLIDSTGTLLTTPFLDISGRVDRAGNEMGLLGLAFHPDYITNGHFYVNYTVDSPRRSRVSRFSVSAGDPNLADPSSELILLEFEQPYANHNGGDLLFGPDRLLYIASGDGGSAGDPLDYGQNEASLLGKILRIDVDQTAGNPPDCHTAAGTNYTIPPTNPFADGAGGSCDEIWATGLRNPWRISFDRQTGDLWLGDVGQDAFEEINLIPAGTTTGPDFGWRCYEGTNPFNTTGCAPANSYTPPVHTYAHSAGGCSVTGGFVYRGTASPTLHGHYIFADFCTAAFTALTNTTVIPLTFAPGSTIATPTTFGEDAAGELYVASRSSGAIYQLTGSIPTTIRLTQTTSTPTPPSLIPTLLLGLFLLIPLTAFSLHKLKT